MVKQRKTSKK